MNYQRQDGSPAMGTVVPVQVFSREGAELYDIKVFTDAEGKQVFEGIPQKPVREPGRLHTSKKGQK